MGAGALVDRRTEDAMKIVDVAVGACATVLVASCGGTGSGASATTASSSQVTQYEQLALQVQSAAGSYGETMAGTGVTTVAECQSVEAQYDGQVRPWVSQMSGMSGGMDSLVSAHDGAMEADMGCDATSMMQELDNHRSMACASTDLAADRAEAARHVQAMTGYTSHGMQRCNEMLAGLDGGGWSWSPMMSGCEMGSGSGGMMTPGGGMMMGGR
jgi:hypothetical protein